MTSDGTYDRYYSYKMSRYQSVWGCEKTAIATKSCVYRPEQGSESFMKKCTNGKAFMSMPEGVCLETALNIVLDAWPWKNSGMIRSANISAAAFICAANTYGLPANVIWLRDAVDCDDVELYRDVELPTIVILDAHKSGAKDSHISHAYIGFSAKTKFLIE